MSATRREVLDDISKAEIRGDYNCHVDPFNEDDAYPVTKDFPFIKKGKIKLVNDLRNQFLVKPFISHQCKKVQHERVFGRENLKGIKSAIVTSNHVYMFDCLSVKYALKGHKTMVSAAYFNNLKGQLGDMMRAGGMLPISLKDLGALREFEKAVSYYLKKDNYVVFYPEQGMWWNYQKPRPFKNGAFHYAVVNNVPVIPVFITFRPSGKFDDEGLMIMYSDVHIMKPIYKNKDLSDKENVNYLRRLNHQMCVDKYEEVYKLKYRLENFAGEF